MGVLEGVQNSIFKNMSEKCHKSKFLCSKILQFSKCAIFFAFRAMREGTLEMRERGVQMRHFCAIAQDLAALLLYLCILFPSSPRSALNLSASLCFACKLVRTYGKLRSRNKRIPLAKGTNGFVRPQALLFPHSPRSSGYLRLHLESVRTVHGKKRPHSTAQKSPISRLGHFQARLGKRTMFGILYRYAPRFSPTKKPSPPGQGELQHGALSEKIPTKK